MQNVGGIPAYLATFFVFLGLQLSGAIDWSWWWITSPLWIGAILTVLLIAFFAVLFTIVLTIKKAFK